MNQERRFNRTREHFVGPGLNSREVKTQENAQKTIAEGFRTLSDLFLIIEENKRFQEGVVSQIDVKSLDKQKQKLKFQFTFPYVRDKVVYDNPDRKQDG